MSQAAEQELHSALLCAKTTLYINFSSRVCIQDACRVMLCHPPVMLTQPTVAAVLDMLGPAWLRQGKAVI
jgi:hypothetical protein